MTQPVAAITLTLEESGILIHTLVGAAAMCTPNPLIEPKTEQDYRILRLYEKLDKANKKLMYND